MTKIFAGFLFVFLDFNLNLNAHSIGLIPDFVGTIFLLLGTQELAAESERYPKLRPWLIGITIYAAAVWVLQLLGVSGNILATILDLAAVIILMYITYQIVMGFLDIEHSRSIDLQAAKAIAMWKIAAVSQVAVAVLGWIPVLNVLLFIAMLVVVIMLLIAINTTRKLYEQNVTTPALPKGPEL
jgi:small-conductance mechanosensitive channel